MNMLHVAYYKFGELCVQTYRAILAYEVVTQLIYQNKIHQSYYSNLEPESWLKWNCPSQRDTVRERGRPSFVP